MNKRNIIINSVLLFCLATLWQQTLHELAHFVAAILFHAKKVTLYHNYVQYDSEALLPAQRIVIAAAGPLFSLFVGMFFQFVCAHFKKRNLVFLFLLYVCAFGYINFGGYLLVAPFFVEGDTGFVINQLGFPFWLQLIVALTGIVFLLFSMKNICRYFVEMATEEIMLNLDERRKFITSLIKAPLFLGIVITTLLNLPVPVFLSLLYPMCSPFTLFWVYGYLLESKYDTANANKQFELLNKISIPLILIVAATVVINRLLVGGIGL